MPRPVRTVAMGSTNGSASRTRRRSTTWITRPSAAGTAASVRKPVSTAPVAPSCTRAIAEP
ncbi:hypothetical protein HR12_03030 [Microbacterium sp. SUBG005]|nr:hypothetical protein HR12_03030 [Microbacterium sp. SUBG005]